MNEHFDKDPCQVEFSRRRVVTKKPLMVFLNRLVLTGLPLDWMLVSFNLTPIENGRWTNDLYFEKRSRCRQVLDVDVIVDIEAYPRVNFVDLIRLIWLLLWSVPVVENSDSSQDLPWIV